MLLTIAIPTYNRAALLEKRLLELIPQLRDDVEILVCNDGSTDATSQICAKYARPGVRIHENGANMGMSGSMLSVFQNAGGKWMWTLGDDDSALPNAVEIVLRAIHKFPDTGVITFRGPTIWLEKEIEFVDLTGYVAERNILDVSFLSSNVYQLSKLRPHLKVFIQSAFTTAPQAVIVLRMLETKTAPLRFLLEDILADTDGNRRWSSLDVCIGWCLLPEFVKDPKLQKQAAVSAWFQTRWLQKYGLREVHDPKSFGQWKRKCRTSDLILSGYGATLFSVLFARPFVFKEFRAGLEAAIIRWLPYFILSNTIKGMRERRGGESVITENT
jgi:hypothetical protein